MFWRVSCSSKRGRDYRSPGGVWWQNPHRSGGRCVAPIDLDSELQTRRLIVPVQPYFPFTLFSKLRGLANMVSSLSRNWWPVANGEQQSAQNSAGIQTLLDVGPGCMLTAAWRY